MNTVALPQEYDYRITSFLAQYPKLLNNFNPEHTVNTYAVPRSWGFCNSLIKGRELDALDSALIAGTIGTEVALKFVQYTKVYTTLPSLESITATPLQAALPTDTASKWAVLSVLLENASKSNIASFAKYSERFGMDLRIYFLRALVKKHPSLMTEDALAKSILELSKYLYQ